MGTGAKGGGGFGRQATGLTKMEEKKSEKYEGERDAGGETW